MTGVSGAAEGARNIIAAKNAHTPTYHTFTEQEKLHIREELLKWYDKNKRDLPWRQLHGIPCTATKRAPSNYSADAQRAYEVWISEIMLQQTQVKTVLAYYTRWMTAWPTIFSLSEASLSSVNEVWAGLGYYSRAKRIHDAARLVVDSYGGVLPRTAVELEKQIPGVGRYTAGAVASIAYGERAELVDGNVVRVLSRLRSIGVDPKSKVAITLHWQLAADLLDPTRPGDFNQALMEHGATVCTPQNPLCTTCPIASNCRAFSEQTAAATVLRQKKPKKAVDRTLISDIEDAASICAVCGDLPKLDEHVVTRYPRKVVKKPPRQQDTAVCILERTLPTSSTDPKSAQHVSEYLLIQRPASGLLGGLWEFPSVILPAPATTTIPEDEGDVDDEDNAAAGTDTSYVTRKLVVQKYVESVLGYSVFPTTPASTDTVKVVARRDLGSVKHLFSHIEQMYWAEHVVVSLPEGASMEDAVASSRAPPTTEKAVESVRKGGKNTAKKKNGKTGAKLDVSVCDERPVYKWVCADTLASEAIPTGLKKVFTLKEKTVPEVPTAKKRRAGNAKDVVGVREAKVRRVEDFFKPAVR